MTDSRIPNAMSELEYAPCAAAVATEIPARHVLEPAAAVAPAPAAAGGKRVRRPIGPPLTAKVECNSYYIINEGYSNHLENFQPL